MATESLFEVENKTHWVYYGLTMIGRVAVSAPSRKRAADLVKKMKFEELAENCTHYVDLNGAIKAIKAKENDNHD